MSSIKIKIDSYSIDIPEPIPLIDALRESGFWIPGLCFHPDLTPVGICGLCVVEIDSFDKPQLACMTRTENGMNIKTDTPLIWDMRREALRKILSTHPHGCLDCDLRHECDRDTCQRGKPKYDRCCGRFSECELRMLTDWMGVPENTPQYEPSELPKLVDQGVFLRDYNLCISCTRCARACRTFEGLDLYRDYFPGGKLDSSKIKPLVDPDCSFCGFCIDSCPTGALSLLDTDFGFLGYFPIGTAGRMSITPPPPSPKMPLLSFSRKRESISTNIKLDEIPETPGRLTFYDSSGQFISSQKCKNLRKCLIEHADDKSIFSFTIQPDY